MRGKRPHRVVKQEIKDWEKSSAIDSKPKDDAERKIHYEERAVSSYADLITQNLELFVHLERLSDAGDKKRTESNDKRDVYTSTSPFIVIRPYLKKPGYFEAVVVTTRYILPHPPTNSNIDEPRKEIISSDVKYYLINSSQAEAIRPGESAVISKNPQYRDSLSTYKIELERNPDGECQVIDTQIEQEAKQRRSHGPLSLDKMVNRFSHLWKITRSLRRLDKAVITEIYQALQSDPRNKSVWQRIESEYHQASGNVKATPGGLYDNSALPDDSLGEIVS